MSRKIRNLISAFNQQQFELIKSMIPVTKTFLPPKEEYDRRLEQIWKSGWISNGGELHQELSKYLKEFLGVPNIILTTNGTLPLQIGLKILGGGGEIITTPFSYVATTSTIVWENCTPVFVDIHPEYLTIDETKIEEAITDKTTAILATHVYGNPCNIEEIERIALKNNLKVIYDAAHCFGVRYKGQSLFNYGDISTCSFHATKIFHTGEGGAMFCKEQELYHKLFYSHNFGHNGPTDFYGVGINAKMSELQAAMGLAVLPYMEKIIARRMEIVEFYNGNLNFSSFTKPILRENTEWNYSYYPIIFDEEAILIKVLKDLKEWNIFPRRYFYPSLNTLNFLSYQKMKVAEDLAPRIICLPLYQDLEETQLKLITSLINKKRL